MTSSRAIISAFTEDQVERLTGVSKRQLRYWAADRFYVPSVKIEDATLGALRLYSFRDLVCLRVISALRNDSKVPFTELKKTKQKLAHLGDDMWAKTTLFVLGRRVVIENSETGHKEEVSSGQGVLRIPLKIVTGEMEAAVRAMRERKPESVGKIIQKRGIAQNQPVISGTRVPVQSIQAFHRAGYSVSEIQRQYPTLTEPDIKAALSHKEVA